MLQTIAGVALLVAVAFIGYRRTFTRLPIGARLVYLTGTEFILVGFALGGGMIGLLDEPTVRSLTPLYSLGLGLIGLILGIQLEVPKLARFPGSHLRTTILQALVTMAAVFAPSWLALRAVFGGGRDVLLASLLMACTAACTAQSALALLAREYRLRGARVMGLLRYVSSLDGTVALAVFGLAVAVTHRAPLLGPGALDGVLWFALSVSIGVAMGLLLQLLTRSRCSEEELVVFVTGMVLFSGGVASYLRLSPLFVTMVMGVVATNLPGSKLRILTLLARLEKPFYVLFLVLAGAVWEPGSTWALPLAALYFAARLLGKLAGGFLASRAEPRPPGGLGLGLISQGGVVVAMVMSYYQMSTVEVSAVAVTAVLIGVIASELVGPGLARALLRKAGEIEG